MCTADVNVRASCVGVDVPAELIFGLHSVRALLQKDPAGVLELWIQTTRSDAAVTEIREQALRFDLTAQDASRKTLDRLSKGETHQGVVVKYRSNAAQRITLESFTATLDSDSLVLALDGVQDPRNLGACLRSADGAGAAGIVISHNRSVTLTSTARKVASGAAELVPLVEVSNLVRSLESLKQTGLPVVGASGDAEHSLYDLDLSGGVVFVMGGEGTGLRRLTRESCDELVRIPMHGSVESLNISVAAALCLFEARRQRSG